MNSLVPKVAAQPASKRKARSKDGGSATLGRSYSREAQRQAALILEVLGGIRKPAQAAQVLGVSVPRYYQLEGRALRGLVSSCEVRSKGRVRSVEAELAILKRQHDRLRQELVRYQALLRMAQRSIGLSPPAPAPEATNGSKHRRRRRPVIRALGAAGHLKEQSEHMAIASAAHEQASQ
jgi:hypothetical protein